MVQYCAVTGIVVESRSDGAPVKSTMTGEQYLIGSGAQARRPTVSSRVERAIAACAWFGASLSMVLRLQRYFLPGMHEVRQARRHVGLRSAPSAVGHFRLTFHLGTGALVALAMWSLCCVLVAASDISSRSVPVKRSMALVRSTCALLVALAATEPTWHRLAGAMMAGGIVGVAFMAWYLARPGAIGFADVRACACVATGAGAFSFGGSLALAACAPAAGAVWSMAERTGRVRAIERRGAPLAALICLAGPALVVASAC